MHPALYYRPGDRLSLAELGAARLDGVVFEVGEGFMPADTVEDADARAASVRGLIPEHMAACGATAAWIHGAGDAPPAVHHIRRTRPARMRVAATPRVLYHERRANPQDVEDVGGVSVTTPFATAMELLFAAASSDGDDGWLTALLLVRPGLILDVRTALAATPRRPGRRRAAQLMAQYESFRTS